MQENQLQQKQVAEVIAKHQSMDGNLLPILHGIQDELGYIPDSAVSEIADALNLSIAEVHGVVSFYHYFRRTPPGKNTIRICRAESCQAMNSKALEKHAQQQLDVDWHGTTKDGAFSLEPVYCLGLCACSPSMMVNDKLFGRVSQQRFDEIVEQFRGAEK